MRSLFLFLPLLLLAGCARLSVSTDVKADGSFSRVVEFAATEPGDGAKAAQIEDIFTLPKPGAGIEVVRRTSEEGETTVTATRSFASGMAAKDVVMLAAKKPQFENEASVKPLGDGRWQYTERLQWKGEKPPDKLARGDEFRLTIKKALPATADTAMIDRVTMKAGISIWRVLFGPSDPMLSLVFMHPSLAERRFRQRAALAVDHTLAEEGVSEEKRRVVLLALGKQADFKKLFSPQEEARKKAAGDPETEMSAGLVPMLFAVKVPGEILETNGERDPLTGEVFWAFYPESAALEDLELRVVYRP